MTKIFYSMIAAEIFRCLSDNTVSFDTLTSIISESYNFVSQKPTYNSKLLHNKLLEALYKKCPDIETVMPADKYLFDSINLDKLEQQFNIDPSDMSLVYELGIAYFNAGKKRRGEQLLRRVASSGYQESRLATDFLNSNCN